MRIKSFTALFCRVNECYRKSGCCLPQKSFLIAFSRSFSQWDIVGAVCLERKPVLTQPLTPLEERYLKHIRKLEVEKSFLSDHEKRKIDERRMEAKLKAGNLEDMDLISKQTAQDFEDASLEEFKKYTPAPRLTEADEKNDRQSTQRKLDSSLILVVKEKLGNEFKWALPQAKHKEGETLRQTAERALQEIATYSSRGTVQFVGNAPVGYYKYKYPKAVRGNGVCGAKVFFFRAVLLNPKEDSVVIHKTETVSDHLWLTHSELEEVLVPVLNKAVQSFLFPDILLDASMDFIEEEEQQLSNTVMNKC